MPGRQLTAPKTRRRTRSDLQKRSLNAFAIASSSNPGGLKVRQHRLGESEGRTKAENRVTASRSGGHNLNPERQTNGSEKEQFSLDIDNGSDSEGNEWRLGQVGSDEDSDIDSDEAMGESDEEKFEGFAFRGSSSRKRKGGLKQTMVKLQEEAGSISLEEPGESSDDDSEGTDDSLGSDAIDLTAMLDASTKDQQPSRKRKVSPGEHEIDSYSRDAIEESGSDDGEENESILSISGDEGSDPAKLFALQSLISTLESNVQEPAAKRQRITEANESRVPSEFGLRSSQKLTVEDLLPSVTNHSLKKPLKIIAANDHPKISGSRTGIPSKLEVPLMKRQQDRLDRNAAYEKSKETLNRWIDTVKHNRRAEHLSFPLPDPSGDIVGGIRCLLPTASSEPLNELENTIQTILQDSGLVMPNGEADEDRIRSFEELQTNKMPLAEVEARRAQLRIARELLFREEVRAKRIKKIKSKSYRRVHRKQREKAEKGVREALTLAGVKISDDGEFNDRRRAEERMGARHRESKWAKTVKDSGRSIWDEDARAGVAEMARRGEDLKRRIEGKQIGIAHDNPGLPSDDTSDSDAHSDDSEEEGSEGEKERRKLFRRLQKVGGSSHLSDPGPGCTSKLSSLKFMQKAEAARKAENDAAAFKLQRELAREGYISDEDQAAATLVGRKKYGPTKPSKGARADSHLSTEFEDRSHSGGCALTLVEPDTVVDTKEPPGTQYPMKLVDRARANSRKGDSEATTKHKVQANPWVDQGEMISRRPHQRKDEKGGRKQFADSKINSKIKASRTKASSTDGILDDVVIDPSLTLKASRPIQLPGKPAVANSRAFCNTSDWQSVTMAPEMSGNDSEDAHLNVPVSIKDQELMKRAFAGDDVVEEFEKEKKKTIHDEEEKIIDNSLPGWGNWTGAGVSKKEEKRNKGKVLSKVEGIKEGKRRDAKLDRVIVNEKRVKKNVKYLASSLPHPFETREQYERSLRLPVGPEWTTKETFQTATKPRVMVKQGRVIDPMCNPFL
ncbi:hypothetical protein FGG08_001516 [Glutinoglossum americanum]|uniref:U3 small nucleolar RNA-associated protein 14 n=1 Tax=Glutinoglossum americanum TaxID=1670608 RepID=A0A9P8IB20_9PEZI|nr:hypothetical protein FGG08_001516 [Glutinoglossum americanum]